MGGKKSEKKKFKKFVAGEADEQAKLKKQNKSSVQNKSEVTDTQTQDSPSCSESHNLDAHDGKTKEENTEQNTGKRKKCDQHVKKNDREFKKPDTENKNVVEGCYKDDKEKSVSGSKNADSPNVAEGINDNVSFYEESSGIQRKDSTTTTCSELGEKNATFQNTSLSDQNGSEFSKQRGNGSSYKRQNQSSVKGKNGWRQGSRNNPGNRQQNSDYYNTNHLKKNNQNYGNAENQGRRNSHGRYQSNMVPYATNKNSYSSNYSEDRHSKSCDVKTDEYQEVETHVSKNLSSLNINAPAFVQAQEISNQSSLNDNCESGQEILNQTPTYDNWESNCESGQEILNQTPIYDNWESGVQEIHYQTHIDDSQLPKEQPISKGDISDDSSWHNASASKTTSKWDKDRKNLPSQQTERDKFDRKTDSRIINQNQVFHDRSEKNDKEYMEFQKIFRDILKYEKVTEKQQDLFEMPQEYSLAHCVAEDMRMGSGIAVNFKRDFKDIDILLNQRQKPGGLAVLENEKNKSKRYIYYLVTKKLSTGKPTYDTLWSSLKKMRDHISENKVKKLAVPTLGCGLDRLEWSRVKPMIEYLFRDVDIEIVVCNFQQMESEGATHKPKSTSCKVVNVIKHIEDIEEYTLIIYFSTEDGHVSEEMKSLNKKFNFLNRFRHEKKTLGQVIRFEDMVTKKYLLCGCITKKTADDPFDFQSLTKCIFAINKANKKDKYEYVGLQVFEDKSDELINEKIITILRNYLRYVEIYVCWVGKLVHRMPPPREY